MAGLSPRPLSNAEAALIRALHDRKGRQQHGAYLAEGARIVAELAGSPVTVRFAFVLADAIPLLETLLPGVPVRILNERHRRLFATSSTQGIGAVIDLPPPATSTLLSDRSNPLLYLDGLSDPGNVGAIARTADWFGHDSIALSPGCSDPYSPKSVRASMGGLFRLPILTHVTLDDLLATGRPLYALDRTGADLSVVPMPRDGVYVIGNEAHGLSSDMRSLAELVSIRGAGRGESLNAAIAAAILLYELAGRRDAAQPSA